MIRKATPIWLKEIQVNQYMEAMDMFAVEATGEKATLQICADSEYAVFLNDSYVGSGQYRTLPNRKVYDTYEVTTLLKQGENTLRVIACSAGVDSSTYRKDLPMLSFALEYEGGCLLSSEKTQVREHPHYESGPVEINSPQLGFTYHYDANAAETPWEQPVRVARDYCYEERPVKRLVHGPLLTGKVLAQGALQRVSEGNVAELMQRDGLFWEDKKTFWDGRKIRKHEGGAYFVLDLGKESAGLFHMKIAADAGTVIDFSWGEHLDDLRVRASIGPRYFAGRYVCREGEQEFTGYFRRMAGRYLQIHITEMKGELTVHEIGMIPTDYPLTREGHFTCNDYLFNHLIEVSARTLKLCMHEHYEDCPWREQALYAYDSYIQMLCGYYLFGEYEFPRASLRLLAESQREDGCLCICAPAHDRMTILSFNLSWIMSLEKYILYSGDTGFGREMLPVAKKILQKVFYVKNNLVYALKGPGNWFFYEWTDGLDGYGPEKDSDTAEAPLSCLYLLAYEAFERILSYTGEQADEITCDKEAIRKAVRDTFRNPDTGLIRTREGDERYHEYTQSLAILSGVSGEEALYEALLNPESGLIPLTLSTSLFKYEALLSGGSHYLEQVLDEVAQIWGKMLFAGATTLWEVSEGAPAFSDAGSLCHAWSAVPVYLLYKYCLGYVPTAPGFASYRLEPQKSRYLSQMDTILYQPGKAEPHRVV